MRTTPASSEADQTIHVDVSNPSPRLEDRKDLSPKKRQALDLADVFEANGKKQVAEEIRRGVAGPKGFTENFLVIWNHEITVGNVFMFGSGVAAVWLISEGICWLMDVNGFIFKRPMASVRNLRRVA